MAEEVKKCDAKKCPGAFIKVILGLVFLALGAIAILKWWGFLMIIIKGCIGLFLILVGVVALAIAKE